MHAAFDTTFFRTLQGLGLIAADLDSDVFANVHTLQQLSLADNALAEILPGWLQTNLTTLDLSHNLLPALSPGQFDGLAASLVTIRLMYNRLALLPARLFSVVFPKLKEACVCLQIV